MNQPDDVPRDVEEHFAGLAADEEEVKCRDCDALIPRVFATYFPRCCPCQDALEANGLADELDTLAVQLRLYAAKRRCNVDLHDLVGIIGINAGRAIRRLVEGWL